MNAHPNRVASTSAPPWCFKCDEAVHRNIGWIIVGGSAITVRGHKFSNHHRADPFSVIGKAHDFVRSPLLEHVGPVDFNVVYKIFRFVAYVNMRDFELQGK